MLFADPLEIPNYKIKLDNLIIVYIYLFILTFDNMCILSFINLLGNTETSTNTRFIILTTNLCKYKKVLSLFLCFSQLAVVGF